MRYEINHSERTGSDSRDFIGAMAPHEDSKGFRRRPDLDKLPMDEIKKVVVNMDDFQRAMNMARRIEISGLPIDQVITGKMIEDFVKS